MLTIFSFYSMLVFSERDYTADIDTSLPELWRWRSIPELNNAGFHCMTETPDGTLWFGVDEGILQYDGVRWTAHKKAQGLTDSVIYSVCAASDGSIYAASNRDLFHYKQGLWQPVLLKNKTSFKFIRTITPSARGGVWVASDEGAFYVKGSQSTFFQLSDQHHDLVDQVVTCPLPIKSKNEIVFHIKEDSQGRVWFITDKVIFCYHQRLDMDDESAWQAHNRYKNENIRYWPQNAKIHETQNGTIWLVSRLAQYTLSPAGNWIPAQKIDYEDVHNEVWDFYQLRNSEILMVSDKYLHAKKPEKWLHLELPRLDKQRTTLFECSRGFLWVAKDRGSVFCVDIRTKRWRTYQDLQYQCTGYDGSRWFINSKAEIVCQQADHWTAYDQKDGLIQVPHRIICAKDGSIWVSGSHEQTAATAMFMNNRWSRTIHSNVCVSFHPGAAWAASNGTLYFGASRHRSFSEPEQGGVVCAIPSEDGYRFVHHPEPDAPGWTTAIAEDAAGNIWVGGSGLWKGDSSGFIKQPLITEGERESEYIDLAMAANGELWSVQQGKGIFRFKNDTWNTINEGLSQTFSHSLLCDNDTTWVSSIDGIHRFQGASWATQLFSDSFSEKGMQIEDIRKEDGHVYWFNMVPYKWTLGMRSKKYTNISANDFKCIQYIPQTEPPDTAIVFSVDRVDHPGNTIIKWNGVSPWHATPKEQLYFSYRINKGSWSPYSRETSTTLLALKPGNYTVEVRARDDDFNIDPTPAVASFYVIPPVWQQGWFLFLMGILIFLIVIILRSYQHRLLTNQQHKTELERVKLRFFTSISHELRTPLTVLLGPLQGIYQRTQDPETKNKLRMMIRNGEKLRTLINQILDFRKLEAGKMKINRSYGDFIQSAQAIFDSLLSYAEMSSIACTFEAPKVSCMAWFDYDKLQILLSNFLSNAIKYTPPGGSVKVIVHIAYEKDAAGTTNPTSTVIRVEDSGPGIPAEEQEHIFNRYYRSDTSKNKGSGLGLALVKDLTQLMGGTVSVKSPITDDRKGTCFTLQLPIHAEAPEDAHNVQIQPEFLVTPIETDSETINDEQTGKPTLLIVDDDEDIRLFMHMELSPLYEIHEASNGSEGLERAAEMMPDLIISDVMMPLMDGTQLCTELKSNPLTSHIPIILLTARTAQEYELEGLLAGADAYITKPFAIDLLKARICTILDARRAMQARFSQEIKLADFDISITSIDQIFLERAVDIIKTRMSDFEFGPAQLAEELHMNERSVQKKIKAITGETPSKLIRLMRLKCAKKLLEEATPDLQVAEIASAVGMIDVNYFGQAFKKQFGTPPSALMAKNRKSLNTKK